MTSPTKPKAPYLGATVVYVDPYMTDKYPGIVTSVLNEERGNVTLTVFQPGTTPFPANAPRIVPFDPEGKQKGSWHWPEEKFNGRQ